MKRAKGAHSVDDLVVPDGVVPVSKSGSREGVIIIEALVDKYLDARDRGTQNGQPLPVASVRGGQDSHRRPRAVLNPELMRESV